MIRAEVKDGIIVNIVVVGEVVPDFLADWPEVTVEGIGWTFDETTGQFIEPPSSIENTDSSAA
jgi:hypothetical protein